MPSHGEVGAHEWPVTAGTDRPVAIGTRTVDNWTAKPSTETGPRCWGPGYTAISAPNVGSCSRGAAPESGGDCPDEARKRAVGPTRIARRWGSPSEAARRRGFRLRHQRPPPVERRASRARPHCGAAAMTAPRPPQHGAYRPVRLSPVTPRVSGSRHRHPGSWGRPEHARGSAACNPYRAG